MKGDTLAGGGASAKFLGGSPKVDDPIKFNYTVAPEELESDESWQAAKAVQDVEAHERIIAQLEPLNDRVLLRRYSEEDNRSVKVADAFQMKSNRGVVLATSSQAVAAGDRVIFGEYSAEDITIDGEELVLISIHDIRLKLNH